jgi:hypothetical protein
MTLYYLQDVLQPLQLSMHILPTAVIRPQGPHLYFSRQDVALNQIPQITNILAISWANLHRRGTRAKFRRTC